MEQTYAQALWKMIEGGSTPKQAISKLRENLAVRGRLALLPRIARAFGRYAARERSKNALTLTVGAHAQRAKKEAKEILSAMRVDADDVVTTVDETLIGGWRLEGREHLYDASYKKFLLSMYNRLTNNR